jgi:hypothetical protein
MVGERQKRNWGQIQFEVVGEDGSIVAAGKSLDSLSEKYEMPVRKDYLAKDSYHETVLDAAISENSEDLASTPVAKDADKILEPEILEDLSVENEPKYVPVSEDFVYKPSRRQMAAKLRFHKYCPPVMMMKLTPLKPEILFPNTGMFVLDYVGQISDDEFKSWLSSPGFWQWFISDDAVEVRLHSLRERAVKVFEEVLNMDTITSDGAEDVRLRGLQVRAAEAILNKDKQLKIENKSIKVSNNFNVPKSLAGADTVKLEQRLASLQEAISE